MRKHLRDLDTVLEKVLLFSNEKDNYFLSTDLRDRFILQHDNITIEAICRKLADDGYVSRSFAKIKGESQPNEPVYYMSYSGLMFHADGGYRSMMTSRRRARRFELFRDWAIIVGAIGAAIVAIPYLLRLVRSLLALL